MSKNLKNKKGNKWYGNNVSIYKEIAFTLLPNKFFNNWYAFVRNNYICNKRQSLLLKYKGKMYLMFNHILHRNSSKD